MGLAQSRKSEKVERNVQFLESANGTTHKYHFWSPYAFFFFALSPVVPHRLTIYL